MRNPQPKEWAAKDYSQNYIADYKAFNFVDGEGVRNSLYVSGCLFACEGCFNKAVQNFRYGTPYTGTQRIYLMSKRSNLGKGRVLYFRCPFKYDACRVLYRAYCSTTWRSRKAFTWRLYYPLQTMSGFTRHAQREIYLEGKLERMYAKRGTTTYNGIPTRRAQRIAKLEAEYERLTAAGWHPANFPLRIRRILEMGL